MPSLKASAIASARRLLLKANVKLVRNRAMRDPVRLLQLKASERGVGTIIDIGANTGQFGEELLNSGWRGRLVSFEPQPDAHAGLTRRAARYAGQWIVPPATALGSSSGEMTMHIAANSVSSSLLPVDARSTDVLEETRTTHTRTVRMETLDHLVDPEWPGPLALKLDTQGYEGEVLRGATKTLARCEVVMLEMLLVPLYQGGEAFADLYRLMENAGFDCITLTEGFADYEKDEVLQVDGVFIRRRSPSPSATT